MPPTRAEYVSQFGSYGSGDGQFTGPDNVAVGPNGLIAVTDMGNHRIQVFHPNGTLAFKFGSYGSGAGEFFGPYGIAFGPSGLLVVSDFGNNRVQLFRLR